jgi:hypothetical protein
MPITTIHRPRFDVSRYSISIWCASHAGSTRVDAPPEDLGVPCPLG